MTEVRWRRFPLVAAHKHAHRWLQFPTHLGRAQNTVEAYGRALEDHLRFCGSVGVDPLQLRADVIAAWIGDLHERTNSRAANVLHLDSRVGLSNATIQQRIIAARSFYEYLVEHGLRERNPVRRGEPGCQGRPPKRGLVRPIERATRASAHRRRRCLGATPSPCRRPPPRAPDDAPPGSRTIRAPA